MKLVPTVELKPRLLRVADARKRSLVPKYVDALTRSQVMCRVASCQWDHVILTCAGVDSSKAE